jgi:hypothetical protein
LFTLGVTNPSLHKLSTIKIISLNRFKVKNPSEQAFFKKLSKIYYEMFLQQKLIIFLSESWKTSGMGYLLRVLEREEEEREREKERVVRESHKELKGR